MGIIVLIVRLFYIVVKGRKCGVFYKWEDCVASVANFDQAVFFGVDSLEEAQLIIVACPIG